ncbi:DUF3122 domain-containing protein [Leptolyngbya sp. CCNP1308]|uniref:DUF3122 domain-containing protein n=1 Tax=Leptolyngbya sp. CCNP1308 TaxID=3110255 RepID=UPI002B20E4C2|nr:DUF3122 domain-containing protein [Leptolyngbya sp. CCNP1308]MEA5448028.1 DUF3122 domain-containing protein [Leptolyngbya sp. CCNP1308]
MQTILRSIGSAFLLGILVLTVVTNVAIAPAQAALRQLEEAPGQIVYQSRQTLKDQQGNSWQAIAFKRTHLAKKATIYLRIVGFPGTAELDHSQPLTLTDSLGKTLTATDISQEMFADKTQIELNAAEYDLQPILMQLELGIPLQLSLPTLDQAEITLNVSPEVVEEWQSLTEST